MEAKTKTAQTSCAGALILDEMYQRAKSANYGKGSAAAEVGFHCRTDSNVSEVSTTPIGLPDDGLPENGNSDDEIEVPLGTAALYFDTADVALMCIDWDNTANLRHSSGRIEDTEAEVRRFADTIYEPFLDQVRRNLENKVPTAITTFASETSREGYIGGATMIKQVLRARIGDELDDWLGSGLFHMEGWYPKLTEIEAEFFDKLFPLNKNKHLANSMRVFKVTDRSKVLLIDDSRSNCEAARRAGFQVVKVQAGQGWEGNIQAD